MNDKNHDKRKHARADIPCKVFVRYADGTIESSYTENISRGGVKTILEKKLELSDIVDLEIYFDEEPMICKGRVAWIKESSIKDSSNGMSYETGIECYTESGK